ncbi:acid-sensing ion channel 2 [Nematostella vectensis]|uniref:acid-sensing ion channel 2 n=1 Tax=Nematostella vectensis TaxID=45351 RepID=UPI0020771BC5|nr:acid-sensing ion channel 2 [Nematostella vectensis]
MADQPRPSVRALVRDFVDRTTCHGIGQINGPQSPLWRVFWMVTFVAGLGMVVHQGVTLFGTFLDRPTSTTIDMTYAPAMDFPAVTICNLNAIRKDHLSQFPDADVLLKGFSEASTPSVTVFLGKDVESFIKQHSEAGPNVTLDPELAFKDVMVEIFAQSELKKLRMAGHGFEELVLGCTWNNIKCNKGDFLKYWRPFWNFRYGNCYTFNQGMSENGVAIKPLTLSNTGPNYGLTLDLFINQEQYIAPYTQEAGVRILLSDQNQIPFPDSDGFTVSPSSSSAVGIKKIFITRIDPFNNGSCYKVTKGLEEGSIYKSVFSHDMGYSVQGCMNSCLANKQRELCNCTEGRFDMMTGLICQEIEAWQCLNRVNMMYQEGGLKCLEKCPQPCTQNVFSRSMSHAHWAEEYKKALSKFIPNNGNGSSVDPNELISHNILRVKIYFEELNMETITYKRNYPVESFLGDVGGQLGLWIGVSVITCAEFAKLLIDLVLCVAKKMNRSDKVQSVCIGRGN